jgi:hypothetical protein
MIAPRVRDRIIKELEKISSALVPHSGQNKIGGVKHFQSLAPAAQQFGVAIGKLRGKVNPGHYETVDAARGDFFALTREICKRASV